MLSTLLVGVAACQAYALRPERSAPEGASEPECPQHLARSTVKNPVCFLTKGGYDDGIGHQLFGTLSVMGAHGVMGDMGHCYVYNAAPRNFSFHHLHPNTEAWRESEAIISGLYEDFRSKFSPSGCATAELVGRSPAVRVPMCRHWPTLNLGEIPCHEDSTWELDHVWYGYSDFDRDHKLLKTVTPFMRAVIRNATKLAVLVAGHLPPQPEDAKPSLAVHMRFGDRKGMLGPVIDGQHEFFKHADLAEYSPMHVFTDGVKDAEGLLTGTAFADADIFGPGNATVIQAMARMVEASVFVGSRSDLSSCAALMRIGLGKKHTYMPERWGWANAFSNQELKLYPEIPAKGK